MPNLEYERAGALLTKARERAGLTRPQLLTRLHEKSLTEIREYRVSAVARWENGGRRPPEDVAKLVDQVLLCDGRLFIAWYGGVALLQDISKLLASEAAFAEQQALLTSGRELDDVYVRRSFERWEPALERRFSAGVSGLGRGAWCEVVADAHRSGSVLVLGDPGSGKTLQLLWEVRRECRMALDGLGTSADINGLGFALYFRAGQLARRLAGAKHTVHCMVDMIAERHQISSQYVKSWLEETIEKGKVVFAIDAIDEVTEEFTIVLQERLSGLARETHCPLLLTRRQTGYPIPHLVPGMAWKLLEYSASQLREACHRWFSARPESARMVERTIRSLPSRGYLLTNPLLLRLECSVWDYLLQRGEPALAFNSRTILYSHFVDALVERWMKRLKEKGQELDLAQKERLRPFIEELAWHLWHEHRRTSGYTGVEIHDGIGKTISSIPLNRADLLQDVIESGFLIRMGDEYCFLHKTLLEFLAACYMSCRPDLVTEVANYCSEPDARTFLRMLVGKQEPPTLLLDRIAAWGEGLLGSDPLSLDVDWAGILHFLADCLIECHTALPRDLRGRVWELIAGCLDMAQRRTDYEWTELDFCLAYKNLYAIEISGGRGSLTYEVRRMIHEYRFLARRMEEETLSFSPEMLASQLTAACYSPCPVVRWTAVWISQAFYARTGTRVDAGCADALLKVLRSDKSPAVRSLAARVVARTEHPAALGVLRQALDDDNRMAAAGAATGLVYLGTREAMSILKAKAQTLLEESPPDQLGDPLRLAAIGALDRILARRVRREPGSSEVLCDNELADIFMRALEDPRPLIRGIAAAALGKMRRHDVLPRLTELIETPDDGRRETRRMRCNAAYAYGTLCFRTDQDRFSQSVEFLSSRLRDKAESRRVRWSAVLGLAGLIKRGYPVPSGVISDLLEGVRDRDPTLSSSCLRAILQSSQEEVFRELTPLLRHFDESRLKLLYHTIGVHPTEMGLEALAWVLSNERRSEILIGVLPAFTSSCRAARKQGIRPPETFLRSTMKRCIDLLRADDLELNISSLFALRELCSFPTFWGEASLTTLRQGIVSEATILLDHENQKVSRLARHLLKLAGGKAGIRLLKSKQKQTTGEGSEMNRESHKEPEEGEQTKDE